MVMPALYSPLNIPFLAGPFLDMRTAISDLAKNYPDVEKYQPSDASWSLICEFRAFFDLIREVLSSLIFLDYVLLSHFPRKLRAMKGILYISPVIEETASLLEDMMRKWKTNWKRDDTYLIAMIVNPTIKFSEFATKDGCSRNQIRRHFVNLMSSKHRRSRHAVDCRKPAGQSVASMNEDKEVAKAELARYLKAGLHERTPDFNLLTFWKDFKEEYPLIYAIALDYMPIQACAVSCRRLFVSSEHTDSLRKRQISLQHFEALERQRFSSGKARLHDIAWSHLDAFQYFVEDRYPADDFFDDNDTTPGKHVEHKSDDDDDDDDDESDKDEEDEEDD
ncbi:hypothetical protein QCA50_004653 [Cerrena zonata]|uniref:HAT C-terminal dimerisation domain-containing protein n=1 Tax=Cerrena zonata TaxID=2478898 RepID=A0AAW0GD77_9APHY